jgi:coenzyme F420 hydrogenase subunit beta
LSKDITEIVEKRGCLYCGACEAVCPKKAITHTKNEYSYRFEVDRALCVDCEICKKVCPGYGIDIKRFDELGEGESLLNDEYYYVSSTNNEVRTKGSSGGGITSILLFLLEKKLIDGAVICTPLDSNMESRGYLATTKEEVLSSAGSKYVPIPLLTIFREIKQHRGKKYALVGLPCHIQGFLKLSEIDKSLRDRVFIKLGLGCGQNVNHSGILHFLKRKKIELQNVKSINFREGNWPGSVVISTLDGEIFKYGYLNYMSLFTLGFFTPVRCQLCTDYLNRYADISFFDAWTKEKLSSGSGGFNIISVKTILGKEVLNKMSDRIYSEEISKEAFDQCMSVNVGVKEDSFYVKSLLGRLLGVIVPEYNHSFGQASLGVQLFALFNLLSSWITSVFTKFFVNVPGIFWDIFIYIYGKFVKLVSKK